MIISRWNGFEIDSSEGYYVFEKEIKTKEKGWEFLVKFLNSPLLWRKIAFELYPKEIQGQAVENKLSTLLKKGLIENTEDKYEYCSLRYVSSISSLVDIFTSLKDSLIEIYLNFCIAPLKSLPAKEYEKLHVWFLKQFEEKKEGKSRWQDYCKIKEKDLLFYGNETYTDCWADHYAFEANFDLDLEEPVNYTFNLSAGDPSFMVYLISTLLRDYDFEFRGDHGISIDRQPDKLADLLD